MAAPRCDATRVSKAVALQVHRLRRPAGDAHCAAQVRSIIRLDRSHRLPPHGWIKIDKRFSAITFQKELSALLQLLSGLQHVSGSTLWISVEQVNKCENHWLQLINIDYLIWLTLTIIDYVIIIIIFFWKPRKTNEQVMKTNEIQWR